MTPMSSYNIVIPAIYKQKGDQMATASILNREVIRDTRVTAAIGVAFFALATALGAYVRIPVPGSPVPITLQTFFVLLSGAILGSRLGGLSQISYAALGLLGLPVFQGAGFGVTSVIGPTGGYLAGFICASVAVGAVVGSGSRSLSRDIVAFATGSALILAMGTLWLAILFRIGPVHAFTIGAMPFIPGDVVKILAAAAACGVISRRARGIFPA